MAAPKFDNFTAFFPYYLAEHANPTCRRLHYAGTLTGSSIALIGSITGTYWMIPLMFVIGYGCAWVGHYKFERNRPATFDYPLWSLIGDYKMLILWLTGRLDAPLKAGIKQYGKIAH